MKKQSNTIPHYQIIQRLQCRYPIGSRVKLTSATSKNAPEPGTLGTVQSIEYSGFIEIVWDNGTITKCEYGEDFFCRAY